MDIVLILGFCLDDSACDDVVPSSEAAEHTTLADYEIVDLPTSHWPMSTTPKELAEVMIAAVC